MEHIMVKIVQAANNAIPLAIVFALLMALSSVRMAAQVDMQQAVAAARAAKVSAGGSIDATSVVHQGPAMVPAHFAQLKLAQGFLLSLNVMEDSDFAGEFRVDESGNIVLPELGSIHVAGKTVPEARQEIAKDLLEHGILNDPQVELNVIEYTAPQVTIVGAVASPGVFPLLAPEGLGDVLALAGDTTILAGDRIEVSAPDSGSKPQMVHYSRGMDTKLLNSVVIQPGDTVHVEPAGVIYVLGGVNRPGGYVMQENGTLTLLQAISLAAGTAQTASVKSIYIMRRNEANTIALLELPYKKMTEGKVADLQLHTNDVVYVPTSRLKSTLINAQGILAAATSASIYAGVVY
jgi:polysaccharide export outer membrane protein